jgi:hypothetical protein
VFTYVQDAVLVESLLEKIVLRAEAKRRKDKKDKNVQSGAGN